MTSKKKLFDLRSKKHLPLIGILSYLMIVIFGTFAFNYAWFGHININQQINTLNIEEQRHRYLTTYMYFLTYTATLFAPLVVYQMYLNWKDQEIYKQAIDLLNQCLDLFLELKKTWLNSRENNLEITYFFMGQYELIEDHQKMCELLKAKQYEIYDVLEKIHHVLDKLSLHIHPDLNEIKMRLTEIMNQIDENVEGIQHIFLFLEEQKWQYGLTHLKLEERLNICLKLDSLCDIGLSTSKNLDPIYYNEVINDQIKALRLAISHIKKQL